MPGKVIGQFNVDLSGGAVRLSNLSGSGAIGANSTAISVQAYGGAVAYSTNGTAPVAGSVGGIVGDNQTQIIAADVSFSSTNLANIYLSGAGSATVFFVKQPRSQTEY